MSNIDNTVLPIMSGNRMDKPQRICAVFDYTTFLGTSSSKKWTFSEALKSFAPVFGTVWNESVKERMSPEDRLWEIALKRLSSNHSDESNLIELVKLAKREGIEEIKLVMPYALDEQQLESIQSHCEAHIKAGKQDEFIITL
ncbi:transporter [Vibrio sp. Y2-5]|nr:transporter [Vibrio sp. Y2-5]